VKNLPTADGKLMTEKELLNRIRLNINEFIDTQFCLFAAFKRSDVKKWESNNPIGNNIQIDIKVVETKVIDLAMVVTAKHTSNEWVFSTVSGASGYKAINDRDNP